MTDSEVYITKHGKINFVDLAGSEMTKKTKSSGKTLEEANNINKSLMVLGKFRLFFSFNRIKFQEGHYKKLITGFQENYPFHFVLHKVYLHI